jgi:hypothetical protein
MIDTPDLIDRLAASATPVQRLRPPLLRAALWLALAAGLLTLLAITHGLRPDIAPRLRQGVFLVSMAGALATCILAAVASFKLCLPDRSRWWILLPVPALAVWVSTIGYGCLTDWVRVGADGIRMGEAVRCFATLLLTGVPLTGAMLVMLRHAAAIRPTEVCASAGLAVAAMTSFALGLLHDLDATIMILVWNLGAAVLIAGLVSAFGGAALARIATLGMSAPPERVPR